jgi:transitional endoplasmic reticulum ATPase
MYTPFLFQSIEAEARMKALIQKGGNAGNFDPVPEITRKHFEEALRTARKSVTATDLDKFEQFRRKFDPIFVNKTGGQSSGPKINWPNSGGQAASKMNVEDELYN